MSYSQMEELKQTYFKVKTETVTHIKDLIQEIKWLKSQELNEKIKELEQEIENLKNTKKYGLVWDSEKEPEQVVLDCQNKLPILKEKKEKKIINDDSWDSNILIQWDNYHSLQVLNYTHKEAIDVIYIDPPYNTWNKDFIYNDKYIDKEDSYKHSKWLNFMEKRLKLAHNLLKEDGVIFISIDDNEQAQLKMLCDEIFWEENFVGIFIKQSKVWWGSDSKFLVKEHEYILIYSKNILRTWEMFIEHDEDYLKRYKEVDEKWRYFWDTLARPWLRNPIEYSVEAPDWTLIHWKWIRSYDRFLEDYKNSEIRIFKKKDWEWSVQFKQRLNVSWKKPRSLSSDFWWTIEGKNEIRDIFWDDKIFSYPKSTKFIKNLISLVESKNWIILDFFAWSWTTWHAVLDLNKEDWGNRKFIVCTNNENNICEKVTYERIKRVSNGYTNSKWKEIEWLWGNLRYYETDFVEVESLKDITDKQKLELTYNAWELLAIKEWIYNELEKNKFWQIFENTTDIVAIYFAESTRKVQEMKERLQEIQAKKWWKVKWYIYNNPFDKTDFKDLKWLELKDIPDPILKVYREINRV